MSNIDKKQLEKAEEIIWKIFNIVARCRENKDIKEIKEIISKYLNDKLKGRENEGNNRV